MGGKSKPGTCKDCGGPCWRGSLRCRSCRSKVDSAILAEEKLAYQKHCKCGKPIGPHSKMCLPCDRIARRKDPEEGLHYRGDIKEGAKWPIHRILGY